MLLPAELNLSALPKPENGKQNNILLHVSKINAFTDFYTTLKVSLTVLTIINYGIHISEKNPFISS